MNKKNLFYKIFDANLLQELKINSLELNIETSNFKKIRPYTSFRDVIIEDLNTLRNLMFQKKNLTLEWGEKILRFIEIKGSGLDNIINIKYKDRQSRLYFKEFLISFLLEHYYYFGDFRFLNAGLKLIKKKRGFNKGVQKAYNNSLTHYLISKI